MEGMRFPVPGLRTAAPFFGGYTTGTACGPEGHCILWSSGKVGDPPPEGLPCSCGMTKVEYQGCPTCGEKRVVLVPCEAWKL